MKSLRWRVLLPALLAVSSWAEVRILAADITPFAYSEDGVAKGAACDLVREMAKRVGHSGKIEVVPLARALETAKHVPNVLIVPIARTPSREASYTWITHLWDERFLLLARDDAKADISNVAAARNLSVGVMRSSAGVKLAEEAGFTKVEEAVNEEVNARKLLVGRMEVWLSSVNAVTSALHKTGISQDRVRRGAVLQTFKIHLAGSLGLEPAEVAKWAAALEAIKKDGTYDRIMTHYQYEP
ncbi:substrate-binding periplasmic protein [Chitinimonas lacunae]|uniref:Substrate-binding periplasmic protein n=1 Tax=Chitinimonas lacunae TaxID=1963018 RepID=A0ABV8MX35_9NEIS